MWWWRWWRWCDGVLIHHKHALRLVHKHIAGDGALQLGAESSIMADRAAALRSMMSQSAAAASQGGAGAPGSYGRLPTQLQSPQSLLNQPPNLYQAFQLDHGRGVPTGAPPGPPPGPPTNQLYPYPAAAAPGLSGAAQSVLLSSSGAGSGNTAGTGMTTKPAFLAPVYLQLANNPCGKNKQG